MTYDFTDRVFHDRYVLQRQIGVGGMATVYAAVDLQLDKQVAIKVLNPDLAKDESQVARFRQEARSVVKIRHDHLVDVTDQNIAADGIPYFVMEFLEGKSLGQVIHEHNGPMPWERALDLVLQVCEALGVAHELGIIHRDVKPGNCFIISRKGADFVKVLDLGIAKLLPHARDASTPPSTRASQGVPGTPEYMAPELARGEPHDHRVDIYSIGIMLYRLLTGQLPFFSPHSPFVTLEMQCTRAPTPLHLVAPNADIPVSIEQITLRALAKAPDERWSSTQELADMLRRARDTELFRRDRKNGSEVTAQYYQLPRIRSRARKLQLASAVLGGLTTAGTLFMLLVLIDVHGRSPAPLAPTRPQKKVNIVDGVNKPVDSAPVGAGPAPAPVAPPPPVVDEPAPQAPAELQVAPVPDTSGERLPERRPDSKRQPSPAAPPAARTPENGARNQLRARQRAVASACKRWLDPLDTFRDVKVDVQFDVAGGVTIHPQPPDATSNLGRCVQTELQKQPYKPVPGLKSRVSVTIKVKR